jgi:hypothetical protein
MHPHGAAIELGERLLVMLIAKPRALSGGRQNDGEGRHKNNPQESSTLAGIFSILPTRVKKKWAVHSGLFARLHASICGESS